ncbi:MAG TPA: hypothetical protein VEA58_12995, partial [Anaerovoracaceae bacterium]|nr:hypothetical protein [Anaerovoracaceae bacterium]
HVYYSKEQADKKAEELNALLTSKETPGVEMVTTGTKRGSYHERVLDNMKFMNTPLDEWSAVPIKGHTKVENDKGEEVDMPIFDFPQGYTEAKSLFAMNTTGDMNCELCGKTPIKRVFWLKNDKKKLTLRVGSECVRYVGEGLSGKENLRKAKIELAKMLDHDMAELAKFVYKTYTRKTLPRYGKTETEWRTSFIGNGGDSEYWKNVQTGIAELNPTELFDDKRLNRSNNDTIYWNYVYKKIPRFGYESQLRYAKQYNESESSVESKLLSWLTKNEKLAVTLINQIITVSKLIGTKDESSFHSDYLDAMDTVSGQKEG